MTARAAGNLVAIHAAADELEVTVPTLRRWLRAGAPQAVQGRRGRGRCAQIDVEAVRAWRAAQCRQDAELHDVLCALATELPTLLAEATWSTFRSVATADKRAIAGALGAAWYASATAVHDCLARYCAEVPEIAQVPEKMDQLMRHFRPFR